MTDEQTAELQAAIASLRGDFRESIARLEGRLDTIAATKNGDHQRIEQQLQDEVYQRKHTDQAVAQLQTWRDRQPRPEDLTASFAAQTERLDTVEKIARGNQLTLAKLAGPAAGGGLIGAAIVELISRLL